MGLNSAKLDAIRAKFAPPEQQVTNTTSSTLESSNNANQQLHSQATQPVSPGAGVVNSGLLRLEAAAKASAESSKSELQSSASVESAGTINFQRVADSISELQVAIHEAHPRMPRLLHDIWATLRSYPECVTLLAEEQCQLVVSGLEKVVDTDLAAITIKSATSGTKTKKGPVTTASLGF
jgi:hypothetical protein